MGSAGLVEHLSRVLKEVHEIYVGKIGRAFEAGVSKWP